jgi:hypothetical protein
MSTRLLSVAGLVVALALGTMAMAEDAAAEKTLTGKMTCAKCELKKTDACQNVLIVTEGDKTTTYYLVANQVSKDFHKNVCQGAKEGVSVTGVVGHEGDNHTITASKIEAKKEG